MFEYPDGLYVDVRIKSIIIPLSALKNTLQEQKVRENKGAFIRVFDGSAGIMPYNGFGQYTSPY